MQQSTKKTTAPLSIRLQLSVKHVKQNADARTVQSRATRQTYDAPREKYVRHCAGKTRYDKGSDLRRYGRGLLSGCHHFAEERRAQMGGGDATSVFRKIEMTVRDISLGQITIIRFRRERRKRKGEGEKNYEPPKFIRWMTRKSRVLQRAKERKTRSLCAQHSLFPQGDDVDLSKALQGLVVQITFLIDMKRMSLLSQKSRYFHLQPRRISPLHLPSLPTPFNNIIKPQRRRTAQGHTPRS